MNLESFQMKLIFYIFFFSQLLNFLGVFADKLKESSSGINSCNWEQVEENKSKPLKDYLEILRRG